MATTIGPTVGEALAAFRTAHGLTADETTARSWTCQIGEVTLRLPNFHWRRRAITAHDLHHLLTGIPCTLRGEFQMAAWEFGAGPMPHWGATLFCLPLVLAGLIWSPGCIWRAYLAGRRSHSLYRRGASERLLAMPLPTARANVVPPGKTTASTADRIRFAALILQASLLSLAPLAGLFGILVASG